MADMRCRTLENWHGDYTNRRKRSQFDSSWTSTRDLLERELRQLSARGAVLELSAEQTDMRNDGWPYANAKVGPAVRLSFDSRHGSLVYQCDTFTTWQDNVRAIALGLEALRKVDRYGVSNEGQQYAGWKQIEQNTSSPMDRINELADLAGIDRETAWAMSSEALIREAKRRTHPDTGGTATAFRRVMELSQ